MNLEDFPAVLWKVSAWDEDRAGVVHLNTRVDVADAKRLLDTIEAAVREQIAREIEEHADKRPNDYGTRWISGDTAARIARGERP